MKSPERYTINSAAQWADHCHQWATGFDATRLVIVHTPSAHAYVRENFAWAQDSHRLVIATEPAATDFKALDDFPEGPRMVVGIGGGKALDAAKAVACWGSAAYHSADAMGAVLLAGGRIETPRLSRLLLVPSVASSGSESSKAAIIAVGGRKTGLRGAALIADGIVYDQRLWETLTPSMALHHAFDILAHLLETTVSLRRTDESIGHAAQGFDRLSHWVLKQDANLAAYQEAMEAAYSAGVCLATSSTCLPHRCQYIIGPETDTAHVEGIWWLSRPWLDLAAAKCPERIADAVRLLPLCQPGVVGLRDFFGLMHNKAASLVRRERFAALRAAAGRLAPLVTGDLAADPAYEGVETIEQLLRQQIS